jgi:uncharacterized protein
VHIDGYVALAGLIVGFVVGMTGMGGGALMTPILVLLFNVQPLAAVSSDLVAAMVMKPVGGAVHARRGTVRWDLVRWLVLGSVPAAFAGVFVLRLFGNAQTLEDRLKILLGVTLLLACAGMLVRAWLEDRRIRLKPWLTRRGPITARPVATMAVGAIGGLMVGMTSVGSGSLIIVMIMLLYPALRGSQIVGTDLAQAIPLVFSAGIAHLIFGDFQLGLTSSVLLGALPGVYLGARLSSRAPDWVIRPSLWVVLFASGLKLVNVSTFWLAMVLLAIVFVVIPVVGAIDAHRRPEAQWQMANIKKRHWVRVQAYGALFGLGLGTAIAYFAKTRPRLEAAGEFLDVIEDLD